MSETVLLPIIYIAASRYLWRVGFSHIAMRPHPGWQRNTRVGLALAILLSVGMGACSWGGQQPSLPPPPNPFRDLSNQQLKTKAQDLAGRMREFQTAHDNRMIQMYTDYQRRSAGAATPRLKSELSRQLGDEHVRRHEDFEKEYTTNYSGQVINLRDEMLHRLGRTSPGFPEELLKGQLAGAAPVSQIASYLEGLAGQLKPDSKTTPQR
jgi:hypothetical protein